MGVTIRLRGYGGADPKKLVLHADHGGPMKGSTLLSMLQRLGIVPSFSRPSVSDDNPYSEALFRTMKYRPGYPRKPFASFEDALRWVDGFVAWYNDQHLHSGIRFVTPSDRHAGRDQPPRMRRSHFRVIVWLLTHISRRVRWSARSRATEWIRVAT